MTCDAEASSGPASLRCSSPCCASRTETLSILQLFTASSFCKRCTHKIFFLSLPPSFSLFPAEMLRQYSPFSFKHEVSHLHMHCTH